MSALHIYAAVALGGAIGACARYTVIATLLRHFPAAFPAGTIAVNVAGSLLAGIVFVLLQEKHVLPAIMRPLLLVGFMGAFTTFSAFSVEVVQLLSEGRISMAAMYTLASVVLCVLACAAGMFLVKLF